MVFQKKNSTCSRPGVNFNFSCLSHEHLCGNRHGIWYTLVPWLGRLTPHPRHTTICLKQVQFNIGINLEGAFLKAQVKKES